MKKINVNSGRADALCDIAKVEELYKAKFVGQFPLKARGGGWIEEPADVYWQANPAEGHKNYFGLIVQNGSLLITDGTSAVEGEITGVVADDGEVVYSRFRHDYRVSTDKSVFIDGGRDYFRCGSVDKLITLKVIDGEFYEIEKEDITSGK